MKIDFRPETEEKLKQVAAQDGHVTAEQLVQDVIEGYLDELAGAREMLERRYGELESGAVRLIPSDEVEEFFREKERRCTPSAIARMTEYGFHPEALADLNEIWEFIRADNLDSADLVIDEIFLPLAVFSLFQSGATGVPT